MTRSRKLTVDLGVGTRIERAGHMIASGARSIRLRCCGRPVVADDASVMKNRSHSRLPVALAAGVAAVLAAAGPAGASEGPLNPPPPTWGPTPIGIAPAPTAGGALPAHAARPSIRRARIVPPRVKRGRRARLRLTLSSPGRVRLVVLRVSRPHRGRVAARTVQATRRGLVLPLPRKAHGTSLARGRYRVTIVMTDAHGGRSRTVRRSFTVR